MDERFVKLENDISQLKESVKLVTFQKNDGEPSNTSKPPTSIPLKPKRKDESKVGFDFNFSNLHDVDMAFNSNIDLELETQEYLRKTLDQLAQDSVVKRFDPKQESPDKDPLEFCTPLTSFQSFLNKTPHLTDDDNDPRCANLPDSSLVHFSQEEWTKFQNWSMSPTDVPIGPSVFSYTMATRILGLGKWLHNPVRDL
ncbi:unnamed protein product [Eruca vesicaria subsp. sativa]|uniref:Uncharacterized protein n=1 Tax=Eruca vesicaria subsp. sativa TaxID=29727 RepID=A0ABC8LP38_ERUVS|nr:unnamed protein product [Eruca vesicaria subsp. sativa]